MNQTQRKIFLDRIGRAHGEAKRRIFDKSDKMPARIKSMRRAVARWEHQQWKRASRVAARVSSKANEARSVVQLVGIKGTGIDALRAVERFEKLAKKAR